MINKNEFLFILLRKNDILFVRRVIEVKPLENINSLDNKTVIRPKIIEEKLEEAEKDYEEGRTYSEEEVWNMFSKKYGFKL